MTTTVTKSVTTTVTMKFSRVLAAAALIAAVAGALVTAGCTTVPTLESARKKDRDCVDTLDATVTQKHARSWFVVQDGELAVISPAADDAVRTASARPTSAPGAATAERGALHRFVFRPADRGDRLYRMAFLPDGGMVAGRRLLADLGFRVASAGVAGPGRTVVLDRRGSRRTIDLSQRPRIRIDVMPLAGGAPTTVEVTLDPDFDGPLLLTPEAAQTLDLDRAEIPGAAEVQVALGRPFNARRAFAAAKCVELGAAGAVEVIVPSGPPESRR